MVSSAYATLRYAFQAVWQQDAAFGKGNCDGSAELFDCEHAYAAAKVDLKCLLLGCIRTDWTLCLLPGSSRRTLSPKGDLSKLRARTIH